ncbi:ADP-ribosylglycohydrolase family protein [Pseudidiomarina terrestris]|uniref:ADP-ribosylglycohydrolase family protein n=1 Tax=Pseudidiomarina terrestris TaxID=2820060 RepID=UPI002656A8E1|nr:ADP-ribosylglycohydrolase family protein [Pseudidiomarina sp. 1ASP75-5]MDN7135350.1 ADP-ribosylglycohydrolase family protein [Pseudidiomarina sp. 1ASP75-5]
MSEQADCKRLGCFWGQCVGDALGSLVEFKTKATISRIYPDGIKKLEASSVFPIAECGQLTDDSEMAIALLNSMHDENGDFIGYSPERAMRNYRDWFDSDPIDCGMTVASAICGAPNPSSESNGALMRASALAINSRLTDEQTLAEWARVDAEITHPNRVCQQANQLFVLLIRFLLESSAERDSGDELYAQALRIVKAYELTTISALVVQARQANMSDFYTNMGWVRIALHNALFHLFNETPWREAVHTTVIQGGDTDTTAAIVGALLGARDGLSAIPEDWLQDVQNAIPVHRPHYLHARHGASLLAEV